jgi:hypothetical protein
VSIKNEINKKKNEREGVLKGDIYFFQKYSKLFMPFAAANMSSLMHCACGK